MVNTIESRVARLIIQTRLRVRIPHVSTMKSAPWQLRRLVYLREVFRDNEGIDWRMIMAMAKEYDLRAALANAATVPTGSANEKAKG